MDPSAASPAGVWLPQVVLARLTLVAAFLLIVVPADAAQAQAPQTRFTWTMEERLHGTADGDAFPIGLPLLPSRDASSYSVGGARPNGYRVHFDACASVGVARYEWEIASQVQRPREGCRFDFAFPREGRYQVTLRGLDASGRRGPPFTAAVTVQDWLVVSLGDSVASGEGHPARERPLWTSARCHRSPRAGPARAARLLEREDPQTSVTFLHLACSGATIDKGLTGPYVGVDPQGGDDANPQLEQLVAETTGRELDAVLVSVGANDIGFSRIVKRCGLPDTCSTKAGVLEKLEEDLGDLSTSYRPFLGRLLLRTGMDGDRVLVSEYFNPARDEDDRLCGRGSSGLLINEHEWEWAEQRVLARLNELIARRADEHGVRFVKGIANRFRTHGYCSKRPGVVRLLESFERQGDPLGTMHPNARGHDIYGKVLFAALRRSLYPGGDPRPPSVLLGGTPPPEEPADEGKANRELAERFRPLLYFDSSENWRPLDVERFLEERDPAHRVCPPDGKCDALTSAGDLDRKGDYWSPEAHLRIARTDDRSDDPVALYYHVTRAGRSDERPMGTMAYIDYWYFFRNNRPRRLPGKHDADWEGLMVTVDLADLRTFKDVAFAAHKPPPWTFDRTVLRCGRPELGSCGSLMEPEGRHVVAYVAAGSHASYPAPCSAPRLRFCGQNRLLRKGGKRGWPEAGFDGSRPWAGNNDDRVLVPLPLAEAETWSSWPGAWDKSGGGVRSPVTQKTLRYLSAPRESPCTMGWCKSVREIVSAYERACGQLPQRAALVLVCQPRAERGQAPRGAPLGQVTIERPTRRLRAVKRSVSVDGAALTEARGSPLEGRGPLVLRGRLDNRAELFVRYETSKKALVARFEERLGLLEEGHMEVVLAGDEPRLRVFGSRGDRRATLSPASVGLEDVDR
jgi:hypothetical protein